MDFVEEHYNTHTHMYARVEDDTVCMIFTILRRQTIFRMLVYAAAAVVVTKYESALSLSRSLYLSLEQISHKTY